MVKRYTVRAAFVVEVTDELAAKDAAFMARRADLLGQLVHEPDDESVSAALSSLFNLGPSGYPGVRVIASTVKTTEPEEAADGSEVEPPTL